jgi:hypothetical protein
MGDPGQRLPRGRFGPVRYDLHGDFGIEPQEHERRRRLDFSFERFGVRAEE